MQDQSDLTWCVAKTVTEAPSVVSIFLEPVSGSERPSYIAGQYLTIKLAGLGPAEGKAYSISSAPHEPLLRITVRKIGRFSSVLCELAAGDTVTTSTPYGFFYPEPDDPTTLVFLAGGIGITPCLSIIKDLTHRADPRPIHLFYSNQTEADVAFRGELEELAATNPHLSIYHFITRESSKQPDYHAGRMTPEIIQAAVSDASQAEYFICGSIDFTKSLWKDLSAANIPTHQLYTEGFF
jgi:ferredoxin-NADP reductase